MKDTDVMDKGATYFYNLGQKAQQERILKIIEEIPFKGVFNYGIQQEYYEELISKIKEKK